MELEGHRAKRLKTVDDDRARIEREALLTLAEQGMFDDDLLLPSSSAGTAQELDNDASVEDKDDMLDEFDAMADLTSEMGYSGDELSQLHHQSSPPRPHAAPVAVNEADAGFFMSVRMNKRINVSEENAIKARKILASPTKSPPHSTTAASSNTVPPVASTSSSHPPPKDSATRPDAVIKPKPKPLTKAAVSTPARAALLQTTPKMASFRSPLLANKAAASTPRPRVNSEIMPRPRPPVQHGFVTPFKNGVRPANLTPKGLPIKQASKKVTKGNTTISSGPAVFNLDFGQPRVQLKDALRPQTRHYEDMVDNSDLPVELLEMTAKIAKKHTFGPHQTPVQALEAVKTAGCSMATLRWVTNHWSLIVWTHASIVRSRPDYISRYWSFDAVVDALLYRYERETNRAHRSAIKRIQERDASAALSMVLCVSDIVRDHEGKTEGFEMTDGWYRIRTNVDAALIGAVERGKIVVGSKLEITGAKLEGQRDGMDPLDAETRALLMISGNSTSLARWDAKLGFVKTAFIATLPKLTCTGGLVAAIDVVVDRVYPVGYTSISGGGGQGMDHETWNADEEEERKEKWEKAREDARATLLEQASKRDESNEWIDLLALLSEAVEEGGSFASSKSSSDKEADEAEDVIDRLDMADGRGEQRQIVRSLNARLATATYLLVKQRAEQHAMDSKFDIEQELERMCPIRQVRSFCVARVRDAQVENDREAQVTIWDADSASSGPVVQEGKRYRMTGLVPKGRWRSTDKEITLSTRRETRMIMIE